MSDSESDLDDFDLESSAKKALANLLPEKSKAKYEKSYQDFKQWCDRKKIKIINEKVLVVYFSEEFKDYKSSTAWCMYSMLRTTLNVKENINIAEYQNLRALLKRKSNGHVAKKSKIFTKEEVYKFIKEASDDKYLAMKVGLIVGVFGACRRDELVNLDPICIQYLENESAIKVTLPKTKTNIVREFVIGRGDDPQINLVQIFKKYADLRPEGAPKKRFFLGYRKGKCIKQAIGIHSIGKWPQEIASFLQLPYPKEYTGHCFRRSSASMLADSGVDVSILKRHGGWSSDKVAEGYVETSINNKRKIAEQILGNKRFQPEDDSDNDPLEEIDNGPVHIHEREISQCVETNVTIVSTQSSAQVVPTEARFPNSSAGITVMKKLHNCTINIYNK